MRWRWKADRGDPSLYLGPGHSGALFLRPFFLGMQKEGARHQGETKTRKEIKTLKLTGYWHTPV